MKAASFIRSNLLPSAGLVVPPLIWALNTELGQILPYAECGTFRYSALISALMVVLALGASWLSWRVVQQNASDAALGVTAYPASFGFLGRLSGLNGVLFAFALLLQAASSLVLTGCER